MIRSTALLLLAACTDEGTVNDSVNGDTVPTDEPLAVLVTSDYEVGSLTTLTLDGVVTPDLLPTSGDTVVQAEGGRIYYLDRTANIVRAYDDRDFLAPAWEVNVGDGANPVSVAGCGGGSSSRATSCRPCSCSTRRRGRPSARSTSRRSPIPTVRPSPTASSRRRTGNST